MTKIGDANAAANDAWAKRRRARDTHEDLPDIPPPPIAAPRAVVLKDMSRAEYSAYVKAAKQRLKITREWRAELDVRYDALPPAY